MTIEIISSNTIKVALEEEDMEAYDLSFDALDRSSEQTKNMLFDLIEKIRTKHNIDISTDKVFVEAFPRNNGGCLIYLSMLSKDTEQHNDNSSFYSSIICSVDSNEDLEQIAMQIYNMYSHIIHDSELYYADSRYVLILHTYKKSDKNMKSFLKEYCDVIGSSEIDCSCIREYNECIISSNAIEEIIRKKL